MIPPFFGSIQPFTGGIWQKRGGILQIQEICDQKRGKMTYQEIADEADVPMRTVGGCLSGTTKAPSVYTVGAICRVLHVSLDDYFGIEPDEPQGTGTSWSLRSSGLSTNGRTTSARTGSSSSSAPLR